MDYLFFNLLEAHWENNVNNYPLLNLAVIVYMYFFFQYNYDKMHSFSESFPRVHYFSVHQFFVRGKIQPIKFIGCDAAGK